MTKRTYHSLNLKQCPSLEQMRKNYPSMTEAGYRSYKRGWIQVQEAFNGKKKKS